MNQETVTQETKVKALIKKCAQETANHWLVSATTQGSPDQITSQLEILKQAAIVVLATYVFNKTREECAGQNIQGQVYSIMEIMGLIEDETDLMFKRFKKGEMKFHDAKEGQNEKL